MLSAKGRIGRQKTHSLTNGHRGISRGIQPPAMKGEEGGKFKESQTDTITTQASELETQQNMRDAFLEAAFAECEMAA